MVSPASTSTASKLSSLDALARCGPAAGAAVPARRDAVRRDRRRRAGGTSEGPEVGERAGQAPEQLVGARSVRAGARVDVHGSAPSRDGWPRAPAIPARCLGESRAALPSAVELRVDPRDSALAAALASGLQIAETLESAGGLELVGQDGREIRNTLEERLGNAEIMLRQRFARWLAATEDGTEDRA